ncbi:hypothetical protein N6L24_03650 [Cognatishimia sp. SS12]|uniref:hypothetical protein n=1 Tax=Cognatishimia sp. SS12 TaxID=2979465 RepID=UPI00232D7550|nr:hypothetical protein [Cognatishimia sp. SS12]MDC0737360.1 hypothetical protein [Cognatishimia sp. SS12]
MLRLIKSHPIAATGFALALALTLFFMARMVLDLLYWADPAHRNQSPEAWMTPRYIAHSWGLDPKDVRAVVGLGPERPRARPTLDWIAKSRDVPVEIVLEEVNALLTQKGAKK